MMALGNANGAVAREGGVVLLCATPDCFKPAEFVWLGFSLCRECHKWAFSMPDAYGFDPATLLHLLWILVREDYPEDLDWEAAIEWAHAEWKAG